MHGNMTSAIYRSKMEECTSLTWLYTYMGDMMDDYDDDG